MRAVLADTGPLYALVDPTDQYHSRAHSELARLSQERFRLAVSCANLLEAYTLLLRKLGTKVAKRWLDEVTEGFDLLNPSRETYLAAGRRVGQYPDQSISLFDAALAVLAEETRFSVWTFDHHFDTLGAPVWR